MNLLAVERIKLFSTRSPWWCMALVVVFGLAFGSLIAGLSGDFPVTVGATQLGISFGQSVIMVLAAIAVTSEYRFGTIRATFAAVPNRTAVLLAKAVLVALLSALIGLVSAFAAWGVVYLIGPEGADLAISSEVEWRAVAGQGLVYALIAVLAVGVGILVRQTAGAISLLLVWWLIIEGIIASLLDSFFELGLSRWMPFANATNFVTAGDPGATGEAQGVPVIDYPFGGPWGSLGYFAAVAVTVLVIGIVVANRRDA
jgi:ABC-2 type transport system permease protein